MRHLKSGKRLGVTTSHRKAMMRNLVTSLLEHGEIKTTLTRAKEMRKYFDKMIGLGKRNNLHARRQALAFVKSKDLVHKLFEEYGPLYQDRNGGYTRIYRTGHRLGDNAQMALIKMVGLDGKEKTKEKFSAETITEVKAELQIEEERAQVEIEAIAEESAKTAEVEVTKDAEGETAEETGESTEATVSPEAETEEKQKAAAETTQERKENEAVSEATGTTETNEQREEVIDKKTDE